MAEEKYIVDSINKRTEAAVILKLWIEKDEIIKQQKIPCKWAGWCPQKELSEQQKEDLSYDILFDEEKNEYYLFSDGNIKKLKKE